MKNNPVKRGDILEVYVDGASKLFFVYKLNNLR